MCLTARRAARVAPVQAMGVADPTRGTSRIRITTGVVFLGLGMAATGMVIAGAPVMLMILTGVGLLVGERGLRVGQTVGDTERFREPRRTIPREREPLP